jgi:methylenetetrahydrofolate--tRNA-(uracil-5-)-methyltransferase
LSGLEVRIIGGGLAGSEAALQLADRGYRVTLSEMRPVRSTEAHQSDRLAEIVCSNSFKSERSDTASGALKFELDTLGCRLLPIARSARVPAGAALALDRELFAAEVSRCVSDHPRIVVRREEITELPDDGPCIVATGPLTSASLQASIAERVGEEALYFYDAIAPSVLLDSVDTGIAFRASRYEKGDADYLNCPLDREEYERFVDALLAAERVPIKDFEKAAYFQGCMPIEAIAEGGRESLRFGPMRPVGLLDPRSGRRPWAVVQLRQETRDGTLYGLVGFQTQLKYPEQKRVFSLIPGLAEAEFVRLGSLHRNTFLDSPRHLDDRLRLRGSDALWFAGQITGCEGYVESLASGLMAALAVDATLKGLEWNPPPGTTLLGGLLGYLRHPAGSRLTPMNVNFGLLPPLDAPPRAKSERKEAYTARARAAMQAWRGDNAELFVGRA